MHPRFPYSENKNSPEDFTLLTPKSTKKNHSPNTHLQTIQSEFNESNENTDFNQQQNKAFRETFNIIISEDKNSDQKLSEKLTTHYFTYLKYFYNNSDNFFGTLIGDTKDSFFQAPVYHGDTPLSHHRMHENKASIVLTSTRSFSLPNNKISPIEEISHLLTFKNKYVNKVTHKIEEKHFSFIETTDMGYDSIILTFDLSLYKTINDFTDSLKNQLAIIKKRNKKENSIIAIIGLKQNNNNNHAILTEKDFEEHVQRINKSNNYFLESNFFPYSIDITSNNTANRKNTKNTPAPIEVLFNILTIYMQTNRNNQNKQPLFFKNNYANQKRATLSAHDTYQDTYQLINEKRNLQIITTSINNYLAHADETLDFISKIFNPTKGKRRAEVFLNLLQNTPLNIINDDYNPNNKYSYKKHLSLKNTILLYALLLSDSQNLKKSVCKDLAFKNIAEAKKHCLDKILLLTNTIFDYPPSEKARNQKLLEIKIIIDNIIQVADSDIELAQTEEKRNEILNHITYLSNNKDNDTNKAHDCSAKVSKYNTL